MISILKLCVKFTHLNSHPHPSRANVLTHWGWVTHTCLSNLTIIVSDNGLVPTRRQVFIWSNDGILLIGSLGTIFSEILIEIHTFSFKKIHLKMSSVNRWPFCLEEDEFSHSSHSVIYLCQLCCCFTMNQVHWRPRQLIFTCNLLAWQPKANTPLRNRILIFTYAP